MIDLTPEQCLAHARIGEFIADRGRDVFVLHGLAGTGKTTVLAQVARENPDAVLCTLTGKAASVLQRKTGLQACTIHSAFYLLAEKKRDAKGKRLLRWEDQHAEGMLKGALVLLDESSMVSDEIARTILRTGARIVACGDPGQLPPVSGHAFFNDPDVTLTEIHRQALESPIIRQAHAVRSGANYEADGAAFRVERSIPDEETRAADAILCWTNKTRHYANKEARRVRGLWMGYPQAGEPVMCLRNNPEFGLYNGAVYTLAAPFIEGTSTIRLDMDGEIIAVRGATFEGMASPVGLQDDDATPFGYGYAMTVHKAQGSEFPFVVLLDEYRRQDDRARWVYTGLTRAADRIVVIR